MTAKFPHIKVKLVGEDGNAFAIIGRVRQAMRRAGVSKDDIDSYTTESTSGDYSKLLNTVYDWVAVDDDDGDEYDEEPYAYD